MPTLWPYLHHLGAIPFNLAATVATYSIGEVLGALLFAYVAKHLPTNRSMVLCQLCGVLGSALYVYPSKLSVLIGRICHGLWTGGSQAIQQAYLADVLPNEELTPTVVAVNAYATLGFVFGPAIGFLISIAVPKGLKVERYMWTGLGMPLDIIAPGFAVLVSACVCTALFAMVFDEETDRAHAAAVESCDAHCQSNNNNNAVYGGAGDSGSDHRGGEYVVIQSDALTKDRDACGVSVDDDESVPLLKTGNDDKIEAEEEGRQQTSGEVRADGYSMQMLVFCNIVFFVHFYGFALQETVMT